MAGAQRDAEQHRAAAARAAAEAERLQAQLGGDRAALDALRAENARLAAEAAASRAAPPADANEAVAGLEAAALVARDEGIAQRSRIARLEAEAAELHTQLERAQAAAAGAGDADADAEARLEAQLEAARAEAGALRQEADRLRAEAAARPAVAEQPAPAEGGAAAAEEAGALREALAVAQAALAAADADRASLRQQLSRLKSQMLGEQDDEEEKVRWRVDAEVKLAMDKLGRGGGGGAVEAQLRSELAAAAERVEALQSEAARWEGAAAARDAELANLQRALGELSYESDAAERLRAELRAQQAEGHTLRTQLDTARLASMAAEDAAASAGGDAAAARGEAEAARDAEAAARREVLALQVALQEARRREEAARATGAPLERAAVVQALAGMLRVRRARDAAELAAT